MHESASVKVHAVTCTRGRWSHSRAHSAWTWLVHPRPGHHPATARGHARLARAYAWLSHSALSELHTHTHARLGRGPAHHAL